MIWIALGIFLVIFAYFVLVKRFTYWKERGVDQYSVYVSVKELLLTSVQLRSIADQVQMVYNDFSGRRYNGFYQFNRPILVIRDPDLIKQVTVKDFDHFVDHLQFFPEDMEPIWEKNLLALKGDKWRDMRAAVSPSFTGSKMRIIFGVISDTAKYFVRYFEEQRATLITLDMKDAFTRFTNDVIASSAFGVSCDSMREPNNNFYVMGKKLINFRGFWKGLRFFFILMLPKMSKLLGLSMFDKDVRKYFTEVVTDNIRTREREGIVRQDMINLLIEARKERSSKQVEVDEDLHVEEFGVEGDSTMGKSEQRKKAEITDMDIVAQALIFFFAGFDGVSTMMCFMAHELAVNPTIQERLQEEIADTLKQCGGNLTYEALSKMKYMDMVVSETLRKWPGGVAADRVCTKPYTISAATDDEKPVHLKKGDMIWVPTFGLQRDPKFYPDPERFDPERFSDENKSNIVPYTYLPFGVGPRVCIGNRFALMEAKLVFFYMLSKFDIVVVDKTAVPLKLAQSLQLVPVGGFWLGLRARKLVNGVH